jgi:hypothetical protein
MKRIPILVVSLLLAVAPSAHAAPQALPDLQGPKIPAVTAPAAVVTAFDHERFFCTEGARTHSITVPNVDADRVVLVVTILPVREPWDRLYGVAIGGVEVLRGTTPRVDMTIRKDITEFASLLPPGGTAAVSLTSGSYVGYLDESVAIEFYANEPTAALVRAPARAVVPSLTWRGLGGDGATASTQATFPEQAPSSAIVELTLSGHGECGEFWYTCGTEPPVFHILVDGTEVATATAMPYVYALLGFGSSIVCDGEQGSNNARLHQVMWWTAQQGADIAGVHTGTGEIPPYRVAIDPADLALLAGARTVTLVQEGGTGAQNWPSSVGFILN